MRRHSRGYTREEVTMWQQVVPLAVTFCAILTVAAASNAGLLLLPPVVTESPEPHVYYSAGKDTHVELKCKAEGTPPLRYQWYKDNSLLEDSTGHVMEITNDTEAGSSLHLKVSPPQQQQERDPGAVKERVAGKYQCRVSNDVPGAVAMSDVAVLEERVFRLQTKKTRRIQRIFTQEEGRSLTLPCNHTFSTLPPAYKWTTVMCPASGSIRGCRPESPDYLRQELQSGRVTMLGDGSLFFSYVKKSDSREDEGKQRIYKCTVTGPTLKEYGGSDTKVIVTQQSVIDSAIPHCEVDNDHVKTLEGEKVSLRCFCKGRPTPTITWRRHPDPVVHKGGVLELAGLTVNDTGLYECTGRNVVGEHVNEHMAVVRLDVESKPVFSLRPSNHNLTMGQSAHLLCSGEGEPAPQLSWYINDRHVTESSADLEYALLSEGTELALERVNQSVTVHCRITNAHGSLTAGAYVTVSERPLTTPTPEAGPTTEYVDDDTSSTPVTTSSYVHIRYVGEVGTGNELVDVKETDRKEKGEKEKGGQKTEVWPEREEWTTRITEEENDENINGIQGEYGSGQPESYHVTPDPEAPSSNFPVPMLVACVCAAVLFVVVVSLIACMGYKYSRRAKKKKREYHVGEMESCCGLQEHALADVRHPDGDSYNSDDSGYDEKDGLRKKKRRASTFDSSFQDFEVQDTRL